MAKINQADNYAANFGICPRSSAIFWIPAVSLGSVRFALSNYWMFKNGVKVLLVASFRNMSGKLIARININFDDSDVLMLNPPQGEELRQGGSVEVEALANEDIRIPYAAIMAIYEADKSISMVHSYARSYSAWEIEEDRTISDGHEGCWTLRDTADVYSFAVLHNGAEPQPAQVANLEVKNYLGETLTCLFSITELHAFETIIVKPVDLIPGLTSFLEGKPGSGTIDFNLKRSFTRLLVGWQSISSNQLQVTHSNFNYAIHETDQVEAASRQLAYMRVPITPFESQAVVYPDFSPGEYKVQAYDQKNVLGNPVRLSSTRSAFAGSTLEFCRVDGALPSRIVTAVERVTSPKENVVPCECSLGILHSKRPPKRFHWGVCHTVFPSKLLIVAYPEIYGEPENPCSLSIKCMQANGEILKTTIRWQEVEKENRASLSLSDMFPALDAINSDDPNSEFCYLTVYSSYGGFNMYTSILKGDSWTLEHTF
jgi:hypothetical protein